MSYLKVIFLVSVNIYNFEYKLSSFYFMLFLQSKQDTFKEKRDNIITEHKQSKEMALKLHNIGSFL